MKKEYDRFNDLQVYYEPKEMGNRPFTIKIGKFYNRKYDLDILQKAVIQQYGTPDMICIPTDRKRWNIQTDKYSFVRYLIYGTSKFQCTWANQHRFYPRGRSLTISISQSKGDSGYNTNLYFDLDDHAVWEEVEQYWARKKKK